MDITTQKPAAPPAPRPAAPPPDTRAARGVTRPGDRIFLGLSRGPASSSWS